MRAAIWLLGLFCVAAAIALFAGSNPGTITVFWPPRRIDLSLNLVLLLLLAVFIVLHLALRGLAALFSLPRQARQWRLQQKERAISAALLDAFAQQLAGRFSRARKSALAALTHERTLGARGVASPLAQQVRVLAHLLAAQSAQALQDTVARDLHWRQATAGESSGDTVAQAEMREGAQLLAAGWALDDQEPVAALARLEALPQGAQRRTLALRLRLKAARMAGQPRAALETARLLAKHGAFSEVGARGIVRGLVTQLLAQAHDPEQVQRAWNALEPAERLMPEVPIEAARRLLALGGEQQLARAWLLPAWDLTQQRPHEVDDALRIKLVLALEASLAAADADWFARIELAQRRNPADVGLQYLAGMSCMQRRLWGKAQQLLAQAAPALSQPELARRAWQALAWLAEERDDALAASTAWKRAAHV